MRLEYLAHACFLFTDGQGRRVLIDPCSPDTGYRLPHLSADATLISHDHFDHNHLAAVSGATRPVRHPQAAAGIEFGGLLADHDAQGGARLGKVRCFYWEMDGLRLCHLGDLGRPLTPGERSELGPVDVLLVPCGGGDYTLGPTAVRAEVQALQPRWVVPMHYATPFLNKTLFPRLEPVSAFLEGQGNVRRLNHSEFRLERRQPGSPEILLLPHKH